MAKRGPKAKKKISKGKPVGRPYKSIEGTEDGFLFVLSAMFASKLKANNHKPIKTSYFQLGLMMASSGVVLRRGYLRTNVIDAEEVYLETKRLGELDVRKETKFAFKNNSLVLRYKAKAILKTKFSKRDTAWIKLSTLALTQFLSENQSEREYIEAEAVLSVLGWDINDSINAHEEEVLNSAKEYVSRHFKLIE